MKFLPQKEVNSVRPILLIYIAHEPVDKYYFQINNNLEIIWKVINIFAFHVGLFFYYKFV